MPIINTEKKYNLLNKKPVNVNKQLIFPNDLVSDSTNVPHIVVFEPATISGHKLNENININDSNRTSIQGSYGSELALYKYNTGSIRQTKGFTDLVKDNKIYKKTEEKIIFPMPNNLTINYNINWSNVNLSDTAFSLDAVNSLKDLHINTFREQGKEAISRIIPGALQRAGISSVKDYYEVASGLLANSYSEVLFKGVSQRTIPFSYTFFPKNRIECDELRNIIYRFKYHSHPEFILNDSNNSYILSPSIFDISFIDLASSQSGKTNSYLPKISSCALFSIKSNYTPDNIYSVLANGSSVGVTLDLQFIELSILTKDAFTSPEDTF